MKAFYYILTLVNPGDNNSEVRLAINACYDKL